MEEGRLVNILTISIFCQDLKKAVCNCIILQITLALGYINKYNVSELASIKCPTFVRCHGKTTVIFEFSGVVISFQLLRPLSCLPTEIKHP